MADAVTTTILKQDPADNLMWVHLTNISDGTGESAVVKVDKSTLTLARTTTEPDALDIVSARWAVQGFAKVTLLWDGGTDVVAMVLCGNGYEDFSPVGGKRDTSTGATGDILLTAPAGATTGSYDITLCLKKRA